MSIKSSKNDVSNILVFFIIIIITKTHGVAVVFLGAAVVVAGVLVVDAVRELVGHPEHGLLGGGRGLFLSLNQKKKLIIYL